MNHELTDHVEREIARRTEWTGPTGDLWRRAIDDARAAAARRRRVLLWSAGGALAASVVLLAWLPHQTASPTPPAAVATRSRVETESMRMHSAPGLSTYAANKQTSLDGVASGSFESNPSDDRHIVRRATIDLLVDDVPATFLKAQQIAIAARGEFVEQSALRGEGREAHAELTLRVDADRLDAALNELRALGAVASEQVTGDDATSHATDLGARLANEQRIEKELQELAGVRKDAPLEDLLRLRSALNDVRLRIEQLQAQRDGLARLASLATILVIIRPADPVENQPLSIGSELQNSMRAAWSDSLVFLSDAAGVLVRIIVGGVVFWAPLALVGLSVSRRWSRRTSL